MKDDPPIPVAAQQAGLPATQHPAPTATPASSTEQEKQLFFAVSDPPGLARPISGWAIRPHWTRSASRALSRGS